MYRQIDRETEIQRQIDRYDGMKGHEEIDGMFLNSRAFVKRCD